MKKLLLGFTLLLISSVMFGQVVYQNNFDSYTVGAFVAQSDSNFTTWSGAPGSSEDAVFSNIQASSGSNSIMVSKDNDLVLLLGNKTAGKFELSYKFFVPVDSCAYYNLLHNFDGGNSDFSHELMVLKDSTFHFFLQGNDTAQVTFNLGEWHTISYTIDLDYDYCVFAIDGTTLYEWPWSLEDGGSVNKISAADFYGYDLYGDGSSKYYIDDVKYEKLINTSIQHASINNMQMYPNPTNDVVYIEADNNIKTLSIIDITGSIVANYEIDRDFYSFSTANLSSGIYYVQINYGDKITVKKLVKK